MHWAASAFGQTGQVPLAGVSPHHAFLLRLSEFPGSRGQPGVQVTPDKAVHVFLKTVWLDPTTMATLPIFDKIPFGPELDFS